MSLINAQIQRVHKEDNIAQLTGQRLRYESVAVREIMELSNCVRSEALEAGRDLPVENDNTTPSTAAPDDK